MDRRWQMFKRYIGSQFRRGVLVGGYNLHSGTVLASHGNGINSTYRIVFPVISQKLLHHGNGPWLIPAILRPLTARIVGVNEAGKKAVVFQYMDLRAGTAPDEPRVLSDVDFRKWILRPER